MGANKPATTAYHEAGHAVAAFFLDLSIGRDSLTIVRKDCSAGVTQVHLQLTGDPELAAAPRTRVRIERFAVMSLAGNTAQKKYAPRSWFAASSDVLGAARLLECISGGCNDILNARLRVAELEARNLVNNRWDEISAVAASLIERKALTATQVEEVIKEVWDKRFGPLGWDRRSMRRLSTLPASDVLSGRTEG